MAETFAQALERRNKETRGANQRQFARRATDHACHENLHQKAATVLNKIRAHHGLLHTDADLWADLRELETALAASRRWVEAQA